MSDAPRRRLRLEVEGLVQGVGFRPFVHRLASQQQLAGWVTNTPAGVSIEVEGSAAALEAFLYALQARRPPHSRIDRLTRRWLTPLTAPAGAPGEGQRREKEEERGERLEAFRILPAALVAPPSPLTALVPADLAPCGACRAELRDPRNRRYGYAFNSCVHCGPRYSLLRALPFERAHTTLAGFALCAACRRDFHDPGNRRFHAQTIGCPDCGPQLSWRQRHAGGIDNGDGDGNSSNGSSSGVSGNDTTKSSNSDGGPGAVALAAAAAALLNDQVVALQGVGGFQLLVRAASAVAVAELRRRKGRPEQPFAVLIPHLAWARRHCQVSAAEARLLVGPAAPIVLLRRRTAPLADGVAPHTPWLGVMLPASPLHALLLDAVGEPLVATSGNRSGEPLGFSEADGLDLLTDLADGLLSHNRPIANPVDDGVAQVVAGAVMVLRQARGTAPTAIALPDPTPPPRAEQPDQPHQPRQLRQPQQPRQADVLLAMGGQVKSAIAIGQGKRALLGPHLGDLGTLAGERRLTSSLLSWLERQQLRPARLAIDLHPGYSAHRLGRELAEAWGGLPVLAVQHHHAHLLACLAEHGLALPATGVAWDGAGFGPDGLLWGGEALRLEPSQAGAALGFTHLARLRPFPLPGGERALREPRRAALGLLVAAFGADSQAHTPPATRAAFGEGEQQLLERLLQTNLQTPLCTSMGRLFDALASLLGLVQRCSFEGQGALQLQAAAQAALDAQEPQGWPAYRLPIGAAAPAASASGVASPWELDWQPLLLALLDDLARGRPVPSIALAFHRALAALLVELAQRLELRRLLLSGGCFQNRLLLELAVAALAKAGVEAVWPQRVPCNDGGLALGQLLALAWSACEEGAEPGVQAPFLAL